MIRTNETRRLKTLVRVSQCFLALGFITAIYHTCASASFWIALLQAQSNDDTGLIDYIAALTGPVLDLLRNVDFLAVATILELMLRIRQMMQLRLPLR